MLYKASEKRGWGAASDRNKDTKVVDRYGISPQLAPPRMTSMDKKCLNSPAVSTPQSTRTPSRMK